MEEISFDVADIALRLALSLAVVVVTLIVYRAIRNAIKRRVEDATRLQSMRVAVRNALAVAGFVIVVIIWLPTGNNLLTALGILGAGLAIASQEMIGSLVAGLNIWRLQGSKYQQVERVLIWPPRMIGGSEVVDYSFLALESNTVTSGKFVAPVQRSGAGDAVTFTLDFDRPAPAAFFKISTFNGAGESPRSKTALRR